MKLSRFVASLALAPALVGAQTTLSTPGGDGTISTFGRPNTQTYGQTFRTPAVDTRMQNFSFWITNSSAFEMKGYVFAWDGAKATGSALFMSDLLFAPVGEFMKTTVQTGGLNLVAGGSYVFFLSTSGLQGEGGASMEWNSYGADTYVDGTFVYLNHDENGDEQAEWTADEWSTWSPTTDLRFEANFNTMDQNVVPEPSTYVLMATGLMGLGAVARRRRQS